MEEGLNNISSMKGRQVLCVKCQCRVDWVKKKRRKSPRQLFIVYIVLTELGSGVGAFVLLV
jgi:hypothetical protein